MFVLSFLQFFIWNYTTFGTMSCKFSFVFDHPIICKTATYIDQSDNSSVCSQFLKRRLVTYIYQKQNYSSYECIFYIIGWKYSKGFISADMIKDHLPPPDDDTLILMCGPPPMINLACLPNLDKLGYTPKMRFAY